MGSRKSSTLNYLLLKLVNLLWQLPLGLVLLFLIVASMGILFPMLFGVLWVFILGLSLFGDVKHLDHGRPVLIGYALISIFVFLGFLAPFRAVCLYLVQFFPKFTMLTNFWIAWIQDLTQVNYIAYLDFYTGLIAASAALIMFTQDIMWRLVQIRQIKTLPKSTTRAAAQGMVKIEGICEPLVRANGPLIINAYRANDGDTTRSVVEKQPFYIVDNHGKVLIDPKNAEVVGGDITYKTENESMLDLRACEIVLSHKSPKTKDQLHGYQLMAGDKVTIYGTARANKHYGTEDPGNEAEVIIKAAKAKLSKFKFHDVFLLTTGSKKNPASVVRRRIFSNVSSLLIVTGLCLLLTYLGYQGMQDFDSVYQSQYLVGMYDGM